MEEGEDKLGVTGETYTVGVGQSSGKVWVTRETSPTLRNEDL